MSITVKTGQKAPLLVSTGPKEANPRSLLSKESVYRRPRLVQLNLS